MRARHFDDHHGFLCQLMLAGIDAATAKIDQVTAEIDRVIGPFADQVAQLDAITGVGVVAAQELIAEIGVDMGRFPTAAHLASWAKFAPIDHQSAGSKQRGATGRGNPWLAGTLGEIVAAVARTDTFLGERYRLPKEGRHDAVRASERHTRPGRVRGVLRGGSPGWRIRTTCRVSCRSGGKQHVA